MDKPVELLRNLGPKSGFWLREAGISTAQELKVAGPVLAFRLVRQQQENVSLNLLWAMAAGLQGRDWRELTEEEKATLLAQLRGE